MCNIASIWTQPKAKNTPNMKLREYFQYLKNPRDSPRGTIWPFATLPYIYKVTLNRVKLSWKTGVFNGSDKK